MINGCLDSSSLDYAYKVLLSVNIQTAQVVC